MSDQSSSEQFCHCDNSDRELYVWRDDPNWWSCFQCDGRVRPLTDDEKRDRAPRPVVPPDARRLWEKVDFRIR